MKNNKKASLKVTSLSVNDLRDASGGATKKGDGTVYGYYGCNICGLPNDISASSCARCGAKFDNVLAPVAPVGGAEEA